MIPVVTNGLLGPDLVTGGLVPGTPSGRYLGRFRQGDLVPLAFAPAGVPGAAPSAIVTGPPGQVATLALWTRDGGATFQSSLIPGQSYAAGTYTVAATFLVSGSPAVLDLTFDVVAGGDPHGGIIALYEHEGVSGRAVIVQTQAGIILEGSDPWI